MTLKAAKEIICNDYTKLNENQLQKYKVKLIDAWRYAKGDYGYNNDFFVYVGEVKAYVPKDYWLLHNIISIMDKLNL